MGLLPPGLMPVADARAAGADERNHPIAVRLRRGGVALLLRHAETDPGIGDPPGFGAAACATQRNLSDAGRSQARRIGAWFEAAGLRPARVLTSDRCRCQETGRLAFGDIAHWAALDSIFSRREAEPAQTAALRAAVAHIEPGRFEVWVTHQVNITALTGDYLSMGRGRIVAPAAHGAGIRVVGKLDIAG